MDDESRKKEEWDPEAPGGSSSFFLPLTARLLCLDPWGNGMKAMAVATMCNNILGIKIISPSFIRHKQ